VRQHKCYIVATCDKDLRRRIRKVGAAVVAFCSSQLMSAWCFAVVE
jgi:U3 small nucleolar RNA-associated protein 24